MLGLADFVSSAPRSALDADLGGAGAALGALALVTISVLLGTYLIRRFEIGQRL
jgi:hypothetical protein